MSDFGENGVYRIQVYDARRMLKAVLYDLYFSHREPFGNPMYVPQWKPDYDQIADWLTDNEGKGLILSGGVGNGKTMMIRTVIPFIVNRIYGKVIHYSTAVQLSSDEEVKYRKHFKVVLNTVDDLGTEDVRTYYGKVEIPFAMLLDEVDQKGGLILASTNMSSQQLRAKYGDRTFDRMLKSLKFVAFTGKSLRSHPLKYDRLDFGQLAELNERQAEWRAWRMHDDEIGKRLRHEHWKTLEDQWRKDRTQECGLTLKEWMQTKATDLTYLHQVWVRENMEGKTERKLSPSLMFMMWLGSHGLLDMHKDTFDCTLPQDLTLAPLLEDLFITL